MRPAAILSLMIWLSLRSCWLNLLALNKIKSDTTVEKYFYFLAAERTLVHYHKSMLYGTNRPITFHWYLSPCSAREAMETEAEEMVKRILLGEGDTIYGLEVTAGNTAIILDGDSECVELSSVTGVLHGPMVTPVKIKDDQNMALGDAASAAPVVVEQQPSHHESDVYVAANPTPPSPKLVNLPTAANVVVALQSADGTYLAGWNNGSVRLEQSFQDRARWTKVHTGGGEVALRSFHGTYLSARDPGWIVLVTYTHQGF
jgi:hypothetical protein